MDAKPNSLTCPVCGGEMNKTKTVHEGSVEWNTFKCTCGHSETRKEDGRKTAVNRSSNALEGFTEFP